MVGSSELEFWATYATEKSLAWKDQVRQPKEKAMRRNCAWAAGRARATQAGRPV